ncbi:MAG: hypothetical protein GY838_19905 [bacterium]|nr:hypothetical protein [bacterium]
MDVTRLLLQRPWRSLTAPLLQRIYAYRYDRRAPRLALARERVAACDRIKPDSRIARETEIMRVFWGCEPFHYWRYDLYRADKEMSDADLLSYIPEFFIYQLFLPLYEKPKYRAMMKDKFLTEDLFQERGIAQPRTLGYLRSGRLVAEGDGHGGIDRWVELAQSGEFRKIFVKPVAGSGGYGILVFRWNGEAFVSGDGDLLDETRLTAIAGTSDHILQAGLIQDSQLAGFYDNAVNTFRIATSNRDGQVRVVCAVLRMGCRGKEVDNTAQGGILLGVDSTTGDSTPWATTELCEPFSAHPDTGAVFDGSRLKAWSEAQEFAVDAARRLPEFTHLGWDIAVTKRGPVAVEANLGFGIDCFQVPLGGLKDDFRIGNPSDYWR